eukprot:2391382-Alexandrium_andersonii.AAC.1
MSWSSDKFGVMTASMRSGFEPWTPMRVLSPRQLPLPALSLPWPWLRAMRTPPARPCRASRRPPCTAMASGTPSPRLGMRPVSYTHLTLPTICSV